MSRRLIPTLLVALFVVACASSETDGGAGGCGCAEGEECVDGVCEIPCVASDDTCPAGKVCLDSYCVEEFRCASDAECPGGRCIDGGCYTLECADDETRECQTPCGTGTETCTGGVWRACDAPIPRIELCSDEVDNDCDGETDEGCEGCTTGEERPCETPCGDEVATCVAGQWQACTGEGACAPDESVEEPCGSCGGIRTRTCNASCEWDPVGECVVPDTVECEPGAVAEEACGTCGGTRTRACNAECTWEAAGDCVVPPGEDCAPGEAENRPCMTEGIQIRRCGEDCTWGDWGRCLM